MHKLIPTIGVEIHTVLNTKTKMFSNAPNIANALPNTNINEVDLGLPGALPSVNESAVVKAIQLALALDMTIDSNLKFDRKNYFYQDLPKGFQITQQYYPIGKNGKILVDGNIYHISDIHIEEDTAKQIVVDGHLCLDYNRCGAPLVEIVSQPQFHDAKQTVIYLNEIKRILVFLDLSDGKMENGSLRVDVNVSLSDNVDQLGTKVEIKNINSFVHVSSAINHEIKRQTDLISSGKNVEQETRRWDETTQQTVAMRSKVDAIDYRFFCEPNVIVIDIGEQIIQAKTRIKPIPNIVRQQLKSLNLKPIIIEQLLDNYELYKIFSYVNNVVKDPNLVVTWIIVELTGRLNSLRINYADVPFKKYETLITMLQFLKDGEINSKQAKVIFDEILDTDFTVKQIIEKHEFKQVKNEQIIVDIVQRLINDNNELVKQYVSRPERVEKFFVGQVMKITKGQANPEITIGILRKLVKAI
ncbi:MAG: Asp-tRNA(Asn)/Glu-tRNA(Gln) amidotransferase subunit GatB [Mycoplasmataceae bacterium]|jgi:aspartyl-tRNA(Asn)/glutamyl-tRNA(Gln) amidotransferase subunit B|nr:Asp-tRNA(Asn)/Glu-tRNA(Gln) amidotransferase subunit GatB [Mycoplasmataceae bacterium]